MSSKAVKESLKKERKTKKTKTKQRKTTKPLTKYEGCKKNIIGQDMRLFKQGKLKQRNNQPVTSRKQAIAIALSMAEKKCKDKKNLADVRKENKNMRRKLSTSLKPADVRNIIAKLKELKRKKKHREYRTLKIQLLSNIVLLPSITPDVKRDIRRYLRNE